MYISITSVDDGQQHARLPASAVIATSDYIIHSQTRTVLALYLLRTIRWGTVQVLDSGSALPGIARLAPPADE